MLQKESWIFITDNTNVKWLKIFHLYKGFKKKFSKEGYFIKGSARVVEPPRLEYKGFKYKYKIKGDICRIWICRTNRNVFYRDRKFLRFKDNSGININKKCNTLSKYINGPVSRSISQRKLVTLFRIVF